MKKIFTGCFIILASTFAFSQATTWFTKVTTNVGLTAGSNFTICFADVNNDDYPDVVALSQAHGNIYNSRKPLKIYLNIDDPNSTVATDRIFQDITATSMVNKVPPDTGQNCNIYTLADFNNDGNVDLVTGIFYDHYTVNTYPNKNDRCRVYLGTGTGVFNYLPNSGLETLGLKNCREFSCLDYDRDGKLDMFLSTFMKDYNANVWDTGYLLKGNGDGTFTNVTTASNIGSKTEPMYGSAVMDYNNDCYPDVLTAPYCRTGGIVWKNNGNGTFTDVASTLGYNLYLTGDGQPACTFTVIPEDVDNDGDMDAFLSVVHGGTDLGEYRTTIIKNKGAANNYTFDLKYDVLPVAAPFSTHRGDYDGAFLDFDNDGYKDVIAAQATYQPTTDRSYFWKQQANGTFVDATPALGLTIADLKSSGSCETFDYDLDGDEDVVFVVGGALRVYRNNIGSTKSWVAIKLNPGAGINKTGVGARIYVYANGKMYMREQTVGRGLHTGQQPFLLNFGLDNATSIDSVIVRWPSANCHSTKVTNPTINSIVTVSSGPTGIEENNNVYTIKAFPNPTTEILVVQGENLVTNLSNVTITDISGRIANITFNKSDKDKLIFNVGNLSTGVYFVKVILKDGTTVMEKIVKE